MCQAGASFDHPAAGRPRWPLLYGLVAPQVAALAVVELSGPPSALRTALRAVLAAGVCVTMAAWIRLNRIAIDLEDWCACASDKTTIRFIESRRPRIAAATADLQGRDGRSDEAVACQAGWNGEADFPRTW